MANIKESRNGSLAKNGKLNEVIRYLNGLLNMTVREGSNAETPRLISAENHSILITTQADTELPFTVSLNADGVLTIAAGHYLVVNTATYLDTTEPAAGDYAYLQIKHSSAGVLDATTPVALVVSPSSGLAATTLDIDDTYIEYSNILLAEVIGDGDETPYTVAQYRSGNCELVLSFTNGKYHYTAAFEGGSA